jgi:hypothetical protein
MPAPSFRVTWKGLPQLQKLLRSRSEEILPAAEAALYREAEETITAAKLVTPVDEGVLRSSGHVQLPRAEGERSVIEFGFGGPAGTGNQGASNEKDVGYAVYVHEDLTANHPVGQAKFLEAPLLARRAGLAARIADRVAARLRR